MGKKKAVSQEQSPKKGEEKTKTPEKAKAVALTRPQAEDLIWKTLAALPFGAAKKRAIIARAYAHLFAEVRGDYEEAEGDLPHLVVEFARFAVTVYRIDSQKQEIEDAIGNALSAIADREGSCAIEEPEASDPRSEEQKRRDQEEQLAREEALVKKALAEQEKLFEAKLSEVKLPKKRARCEKCGVLKANCICLAVPVAKQVAKRIAPQESAIAEPPPRVRRRERSRKK